jgi:ribosomal protein S18 acetylase RimI-like enzyme
MALDIRPIEDRDVERVAALWENCGLTRPWNDPQADIALARRSPQAEVFVGLEGSRLIASVLCGSDGHRGWLYYLAVDPEQQMNGLGKRMVARAEAWLRAQGVPKVELMIRDGNESVRDFYEAIGYAVEPRVVMSRWLSPRAE